MHSNLTSLLAQQHVADLHERAAIYRTSHLSQRSQPSERRPVHRYLAPLRLTMQPVHRGRTA